MQYYLLSGLDFFINEIDDQGKQYQDKKLHEYYAALIALTFVHLLLLSLVC